MVSHEIVQLPALTDRRELRCSTPYYLHSQFLAWQKEFTRRFSNMVRMISQIVSDLPVRRTGAEEVAGSHWAPRGQFKYQSDAPQGLPAATNLAEDKKGVRKH